MKIKALINKGVEIDSTLLSIEEDSDQVAKLMKNLEELVGEANSLQLNDDSNSVARYIVHETEHLYRDCYQSHLTNEEVNTQYSRKLSFGVLKISLMLLSTILSA